MASYHFRIKSDKKSDGTRVSASVHVDYISRQGKYKNEGADKIQETNTITFAGENIFRDDNFPLYLTDNFGKIFNTPQGLQVKGKYTPTTLSIALTLAKNISDNQPLILKGSQKFKDKILATAVDAELNIKFADENLQFKFQNLLEMKKNDERKFQQGRGKIFYSRPLSQSNFKKFDSRTISDVAERGLSVQNVSAKSVANSVAASATDVFLSPDELSKLVEGGKQSYTRLRWNLSSEQRNLAEQTSKKILENLEDLKIQVSATSHFEYINREKKYAQRGDCIFTHHHLPSWANDNPKNFFKAADKFEGKINRRYIEVEFSLPNELTSVDDYKKIIDQFIDHHLKDHYYTYAIHDKLGAFSGIRHPHCHIMFSDRLIDDVEKIQERKPENFFKYPARKKRDGSQPTFEEKILRGAPKEPKWSENPYHSKYISQLREDFAKIQNEVLAEKGFDVRVDHRSLKAQRDDAIKNGDKFLAELLNRVPEKYLSSLPLDDNCPEVQALKKTRAERTARANKLFAADFISQKSAEVEQAKKVSDFSCVFQDLNKFDFVAEPYEKHIKNLKAEILDLNKEINSLRRLLISTRDAEQQAKLQYMSKSDKKFFLQFQDTKSRRDNLQKFLTDFENISGDFKMTFAYNEIENRAKNKIRALDSNLNMFQKFFDEVELKLQAPNIRKNINFATRNILAQNNFVRDKLQIALNKLNVANQKLRDEFIIAKPEQKVFSRDDFLNLLQHPRALLEKNVMSLKYKKRKLTDKLITLPRARSMAENIFVHSELKKLLPKKFTCQLAPDNFTYDKSGDTFPIARLDFKIPDKDFKKLKVRAKELNGNFSDIVHNFIFRTTADRDTFIAEFKPPQIRDFKIIREEYRLLEKKKDKLSPKDFNDRKKSLEDEFSELRKLCTPSDAQQKITDIALGILRKNKKFSVAISDLDKKIKSMESQMQRLNKQMIYAVANPPPRKFNPAETKLAYDALQAAHNQNSLASTVANILTEGSKDAAAIGQSASITNKGFEMEKDWDTMSELDKDELAHKKTLARI